MEQEGLYVNSGALQPLYKQAWLYKLVMLGQAPLDMQELWGTKSSVHTLSVSTSQSTSPAAISSPSFFFHAAMLP